MSDVFDKETRSRIMRSIKSKGNKSTELKFTEYLKEFRIKGWRRSYKLYGKPDFVFLKSKTAVFIDGCFWHGHDCRNTKPKTNEEYWRKKIERNKERDKEVTEHLRSKGWRVIRIWECQLKKKNKNQLINTLKDLQ